MKDNPADKVYTPEQALKVCKEYNDKIEGTYQEDYVEYIVEVVNVEEGE